MTPCGSDRQKTQNIKISTYPHNEDAGMAVHEFEVASDGKHACVAGHKAATDLGCCIGAQ